MIALGYVTRGHYVQEALLCLGAFVAAAGTYVYAWLSYDHAR